MMDSEGYEKFKSRRWEVLKDPPPGPDARCTAGEFVRFRGAEGAVDIRCDGSKRYADGMYKKDSHRIEVGDDQIVMIDDDQRIRFEAKVAGSFAGSWTAEDRGPWPIDG